MSDILHAIITEQPTGIQKNMLQFSTNYSILYINKLFFKQNSDRIPPPPIACCYKNSMQGFINH